MTCAPSWPSHPPEPVTLSATETHPHAPLRAHRPQAVTNADPAISHQSRASGALPAPRPALRATLHCSLLLSPGALQAGPPEPPASPRPHTLLARPWRRHGHPDGLSGGGAPAQVGPSRVPLLSPLCSAATEPTPRSTGCPDTATFPPSRLKGNTDHTDVRSLDVPELKHMAPHAVLATLSSPHGATQSSVFTAAVTSDLSFGAILLQTGTLTSVHLVASWQRQCVAPKPTPSEPSSLPAVPTTDSEGGLASAGHPPPFCHQDRPGGRDSPPQTCLWSC